MPELSGKDKKGMESCVKVARARDRKQRDSPHPPGVHLLNSICNKGLTCWEIVRDGPLGAKRGGEGGLSWGGGSLYTPT